MMIAYDKIYYIRLIIEFIKIRKNFTLLFCRKHFFRKEIFSVENLDKSNLRQYIQPRQA